MKRMLNINKTIAAIVVSNFIHLIVVIGVLLYLCYFNSEKGIYSGFDSAYLFFFIIVFISVMINGFIAVRNALVFKYTDTQYEMLKDTLTRLEDLNKTLRGQRHDFMNHLQVVYSLMEMEEYKEAVNYIDQVYKDIQNVNKVLKTSNPAVNALLQAKLLDCEKRGIKTLLYVTSRLDDLKVPSWEFCRVLGNIIDNAAYALKDKNDEKTIEIRLFEDIKSYVTVIKNNGPEIPVSIINRIFETGFSTKGNEGEGMGLSISKNIIENYNGNIKVKSSSTETEFEIYLPNENDNSLKATS